MERWSIYREEEWLETRNKAWQAVGAQHLQLHVLRVSAELLHKGHGRQRDRGREYKLSHIVHHNELYQKGPAIDAPEPQLLDTYLPEKQSLLGCSATALFAVPAGAAGLRLRLPSP